MSEELCRGFENGCWCNRCKEQEDRWFMASTPLRWALYCAAARLMALFLRKRSTFQIRRSTGAEA